VHERKERVADRLHDQRAAEGQTAADAVDDRAGDGEGDQPHRRAECQHEAGSIERNAAHVVQVDDEERVCDSLSEPVGEPAHLQQPHRARQIGVQRANVGGDGLHGGRA
jgi:hypothetical protein